MIIWNRIIALLQVDYFFTICLEVDVQSLVLFCLPSLISAVSKTCINSFTLPYSGLMCFVFYYFPVLKREIKKKSSRFRVHLCLYGFAESHYRNHISVCDYS